MVEKMHLFNFSLQLALKINVSDCSDYYIKFVGFCVLLIGTFPIFARLDEVFLILADGWLKK